MKEQFQINDNGQISIGPKDIKDQLQKILANGDFEATKQQFDFLSFVVLETNSGRQENIKGYEVATKVFGRSADFDPSTNPIVSMQANKLRRALGWYCLTSGVDDSIRIDIPKSCYVPIFSNQQPLKQETEKEAESEAVNNSDCPWPRVAIFPFENFTGYEKNCFLSLSIAEELSAYEAMLIHYEFDQNITVENFEKANEAFNYSCGTFPNGGLKELMHARFLATFYSLGPPEFETRSDKARSYAEKGVRPDSKLLDLQPDFVTTGKRLISRHIKHETLQEAVI